jgi:hypothetical protein
MADEQTASEEPVSIESIAAEYNLSQESQPPIVGEPQVAQPPSTPVPVTESDGLNRWAQEQTQQTADLRNTLHSTVAELNAEKQYLAAQREEQELNTLVKGVAEKLEGVPDKMVKYALADRYNSDEAFKTIFDNRKKSPQALEKALNVLMPELRKDFAIKSDPQIAENQRAMSEGTRGTHSPASDPQDQTAALLNMNSSEFMMNWEKIKAGG